MNKQLTKNYKAKKMMLWLGMISMSMTFADLQVRMLLAVLERIGYLNLIFP